VDGGRSIPDVRAAQAALKRSGSQNLPKAPLMDVRVIAATSKGAHEPLMSSIAVIFCNLLRQVVRLQRLATLPAAEGQATDKAYASRSRSLARQR
jgi:hypothetical protein